MLNDHSTRSSTRWVLKSYVITAHSCVAGMVAAVAAVEEMTLTVVTVADISVVIRT